MSKPKRTDDELAAAFWSHVEVTGFCWNWRGVRRGGRTNSYGSFYASEGYIGAHRYAYQMLIGPIEEGMTLEHLCRNVICVNPDHLVQMSRAENSAGSFGANVISAARRAAQYCARGHLFDEENTFWSKGRTDRPIRGCRQCRRDNKRKSRRMIARRVVAEEVVSR